MFGKAYQPASSVVPCNSVTLRLSPSNYVTTFLLSVIFTFSTCLPACIFSCSVSVCYLPPIARPAPNQLPCIRNSDSKYSPVLIFKRFKREGPLLPVLREPPTHPSNPKPVITLPLLPLVCPCCLHDRLSLRKLLQRFSWGR